MNYYHLELIILNNFFSEQKIKTKSKQQQQRGRYPYFTGKRVKAQRLQDLPNVTEMKNKWSGQDVNPGVSEHKAYVLPTSTWARMLKWRSMCSCVHSSTMRFFCPCSSYLQ